MSVEVVHRPESSQFEAEVDGEVAVLVYERDGDSVVMTHTVVPRRLEGRGIAGQLAQTAVGWAQEQGLTVVPQCSYVRGWMEEHA